MMMIDDDGIPFFFHQPAHFTYFSQKDIFIVYECSLSLWFRF